MKPQAAKKLAAFERALEAWKKATAVRVAAEAAYALRHGKPTR